MSERLPELGPSGNGWITNRPDAFGLPRRVRDGARDLAYVYAAAGRLLKVKETLSDRPWKEWVWAGNNGRWVWENSGATAGSQADYCLGQYSHSGYRNRS